MVSLLKNFVCVSRIIKKNGGIICFEWPKQCTYWKRKDIIAMIRDLDLTRTNFCGCALGLKSFNPNNSHMFLKKPWSVLSNAESIGKVFSKFTCPGVSKNHVHDQCRGVNAKASERYTDLFASSVHRALRMELKC
jgi:hypothetical protein